ncbi:PREDICTED: probable acyl-activating enzyme 5, peroxisomal [Camelina sativa]|uniref:Probable acyl-activating enzyme 5, peroxisomal n=1 Tax=Camelina sativa TaxID=90675 RepID=A0ABM0VBM8_CAMSA|nr:PREDICTED: probable acyl-activating enzyme 5, peroxisomal [Camelina sativa]
MEAMKPCAANSPPLTPLGFLERAAIVYGDCTSIVYGSNTVYTWRETSLRCLSVASSLSSLGIGRSDVVSVLSPNTPAMYELQFAVPMSGAILNNINTRLDARTVSVLLTHSGSKLLFVDVFFCSLAVEAISMMTTDPPVLVFIADKEEEGGCRADVADRNKFSYTYDDLVERGDPNFKWIRPESEWDPIVLNYTSGTTSAPKGVVHCHRGIFVMSIDSLIDWTVPKNPVYLWTLPMFHANGWCYPWGIAAVGGTNVCLRKFEASLTYRLIRDHNVTHMCGAPVVLNMLSATQESHQPLKRPVNILTAGAPPPAAVILRAESIGFVISHGYGLTEAAGVVVSCVWKPQWNRLPASDRARLKARQGVRTVGFTEIDVVDPESGRGVERNRETVGEIVMKGSSIMLGYLKDPSGTEKALKNGWFYTGDVGVIHSDGYLEIKDRSKDIIISGGENVSSVEVEAVLYTNPAVSEVAVVARPDEFWGETPCAFVSLKEGLSVEPTEEELIEYCRNKMSRFMVPKTVLFRDELPKTSTGKVSRLVLKEIAKTMGDETIS